ncbi:MAG TPA: GAF domain-containing protein [Acidimicrobiales bacterium]|nr:GAF domain-containing protein [Acidimicrobiales bacterium]
MRTVAELTLGREPDAVPRARRLVRSALADAMPEVAPDAELVVSELVTNAVLHGEPPITIRVLLNEVVRLEVQDMGRSAPILLQQGPDAMTGRGLSMVAAVAGRWGVDALEADGKCVWAELDPESPPGSVSTPPTVDLDALLEAWADDDPATATYAVKLGAVSTELLLAAKSHIDNVVRELVLMREGEASSGVMLAPELSALIQTVTVDFAEARTEIKRQAAAAAARGDVLTELELHLTPSAAEAGERYLEALDQADRYGRSAHLLTLAPPRIHRLFRQWYVRAIIEQLRAMAVGSPPPPAVPFQVVLAREVADLERAAASAPHLTVLQRVSSELARAVSPDQMARSVVDHALELPGVEMARVRLLSPDGMLRTVAWRGAPGRADPTDFDIPLDSDLPGVVAARTRQPLHMRSVAEAFGNFPDLASQFEAGLSGHAMPLVAGDRLLGLLNLVFAGGELSDEAELALVSSLADVLASALERTNAQRSGRLLDSSVAVLAGQKEVLERMVAGEPLPAVLDSLVRIIEAAMEGGIGSVLLLDADGRHLRHGAAQGLPDDYVAAIDGLEIGPTAGSCGTAAFTRRQVIVEDIADDPLWDDYRQLALSAGLRACWSTPIVAGDGELLGTFAVYYREPRAPSEEDQDLIGLLVQTAAVAIGRSRADVQRETALADLRFVLEATTRVNASLDSDDTLRTLARIAVPALADVCLIDLFDGVSFRRVAMAAAETLPAEAVGQLDLEPPDPTGDHPAAAALRTGRAVFEEAAAADAQPGRVHSWVAIPLAARGRSLGAMTLGLVEPERRYTGADVGMVEDLGRRVALAIDNTQLYEGTRDAERRLALVARAGVSLTSSLELDTVVSRLCGLISGEIADRCEVYVRRAPEQWWRFTSGSSNQRLVRVDGMPTRVAEAVDGRSTVVARGPAEEAFSDQSGVEGETVTTIVPLVAHGDAVGVIALASPGAEGPTRVPGETVDVIAGRAALAVDNALLYEQERTAAEILQRSLLPSHLPTAAGVRAAARYLPAGARNEIGGDWYDLFDLGPGRLGVVMGDVMGRGIPAASIMGQLRNGLRMLAIQDTDPAAALGLLNRMLTDEEESPLATVAYGVIDVPARRLALANAGHLPPVLIRGGSSRYLDQKPGLPLGAFADAEYSTIVHDLEPGDGLILYTDGLIEQRDRSLEEGLEALLVATAIVPPGDPDQLCDLLLESFRRDVDEDDTAALVLLID